MAITTDYNSTKFLLELKAEMETNYTILIAEMIVVCKTFLNDARGQIQDHAMHTYIDRTKQLRGSIAAYIYRNGKIIWSDEGENGKESRRKISEFIHLTPSGFDIIGIASKEYASWVESKGYNVITRQGDVFLVDLEDEFKKWSKRTKYVGI